MRSSITVWATIFNLAAASTVRDLTSNTFSEFVKGNELSLVAFTAPWCQYCQALEPEYDAAADELLTQGISLAKVDCDAEESLCKDNKIGIYPTILNFRKGRREYTGRRTTGDIVSYIGRLREPSLIQLDSDQTTGFKAKDNITVIGYFDESDQNSKTVFSGLAENYHGSFPFAHVESDSFGTAEKLQKPSMVVYKNFDYGRSVFTEPFEDRKLVEFLEDAAVPLVREVGVDLPEIRTGHPMPYALIFAERSDAQRHDMIHELLPLVQKTDDFIVWFVIDPVELPEYVERVGLSAETKWPAFAIEDSQNKFKYTLTPEDGARGLTPGVLGGLVEDFFAGKLKSEGKKEKTDPEHSEL